MRGTVQGRAGVRGEREGSQAIEVRHQAAQIEAICAAHRASRAVISGLFADSGKNLRTRHYISRGGDASAPEARVCCETTEACFAPTHQRCRERSKPKPSKSRGVDTLVDTGIEAKMLGAGRVPLASANTRPRVQRREQSANCVWDREMELLFRCLCRGTYGHVVQDQGPCAEDAERTVTLLPHSPVGPCVVH